MYYKNQIIDIQFSSMFYIDRMKQGRCCSTFFTSRTFYGKNIEPLNVNQTVYEPHPDMSEDQDLRTFRFGVVYTCNRLFPSTWKCASRQDFFGD